MNKFLEIIGEYNKILNEMIENSKAFENNIHSMSEKQKVNFLKSHENLSKALENVARKINNSTK